MIIFARKDMDEIFKRKCFSAGGTQEAQICRFHDFYLRIETTDNHGEYLIKKYRYNDRLPISEEYVPLERLREYAYQYRNLD